MALIIIKQSKITLSSDRLKKNYTRLVKGLHKAKVKKQSWLKKDCVLVLVDAPESKQLNHQFRGKNQATDVLSFAGVEKSSFGEIVICLPVAKAQAKSNGHSLINEVTYLLLHGILHCLGYEHEAPASAGAAKKMFKIQDKVFLQFQK